MSDGTGEGPLEVKAEDGSVVLLLPNGDAISLSAQAAEETSHRLLNAAFWANGQRLLQSHDPKRAANSSRRE